MSQRRHPRFRAFPPFRIRRCHQPGLRLRFRLHRFPLQMPPVPLPRAEIWIWLAWRNSLPKWQKPSRIKMPRRCRQLRQSRLHQLRRSHHQSLRSLPQLPLPQLSWLPRFHRFPRCHLCRQFRQLYQLLQSFRQHQHSPHRHPPPRHQLFPQHRQHRRLVSPRQMSQVSPLKCQPWVNLSPKALSPNG